MEKLLIIADNHHTHKFDSFVVDGMGEVVVTPGEVDFFNNGDAEQPILPESSSRRRASHAGPRTLDSLRSLRCAKPQTVAQSFRTLVGRGFERTPMVSVEDFDFIFLRTKILEFLRQLELLRLDVPIANTPHATLRSLHRYTAIKTAGEAGVCVPRQFCNGQLVDSDLIMKTPIDDDSAVPYKINAMEWNRSSNDKRSFPIYAQEVLSSKWEYKIYVTWDHCRCFRQTPTMIEPDKLSTREPIPHSEAPVRQALLAARAMGLVVASVDFLRSGGRFFMTDINPTPGLQNLEGGYSMIAPYLRAIVSGHHRKFGVPVNAIEQGVST